MKWNDSKMDLLFRNMVVMLSLLLAIYITYSNRHFFHDDAYITLRYARNYLSGYGFVWNPGETIQGYTSFLHLFILTFLGRFGVDLVLAAHLIGFTALAALLGVMILTGIAIRNESGFPAWYLPPILVVTSAPLLVWALGGLEGTLFSLCVAAGSTLILCTSSASGKSWLYLWSGFLGGICFLARPDGIIVIFVSLFWLFWQASTNQPHDWSHCFGYLLGVLIIAIPYAIWQTTYYGNLVPIVVHQSWLRLSPAC